MSDLTLYEVRRDFLRGIQDADLHDAMGNHFDALIDSIRAEVVAPIRGWIEEHRVGNGGFDCVQARDVHQILERVLLSNDQRPARELRECTICGEKVPVSHATETWEALHRHERVDPVQESGPSETGFYTSSGYGENYPRLMAQVDRAVSGAPVSGDVIREAMEHRTDAGS